MINPMNLDGRVVMVTGAGQGIGRAIAELVVELGGKVVAIDVKPDGVNDLASDLPKLRALFDLFEHKTRLMQLLDQSGRSQGVQIFIGGDSTVVPLDEMSVVVAPYEVDGRVVGTLGVIGPTRMAYERVIPIVDITAKLLSNALSRE